MSLMELFSDYADKQNIVLNQCGNTGNMDVKSHVTAVDRVAVGGNTGNMGNIKNNTLEVNFSECVPLVKCFDCLNFQAINPHGKGAGHCSSGVQPSAHCFWAETTRQCESFSPKLVRCYTPEGAMFEVTAKNKAHAAFLVAMNPNPNRN